MKKIFTIFLLLGTTMTASGCLSKCAPLDRTYPSQREDKSQASSNLASPSSASSSSSANAPSRIRFAVNDCENKNLALAIEKFIGV